MNAVDIAPKDTLAAELARYKHSHLVDRDTATLIANGIELGVDNTWVTVRPGYIEGLAGKFLTIAEIGEKYQCDPWQELTLYRDDHTLFPLIEAKGRAVLRRTVHTPDMSYDYHEVVGLDEIDQEILIRERTSVYRHPTHHELTYATFARGRRPMWLKELLDHGYNLDDLVDYVWCDS